MGVIVVTYNSMGYVEELMDSMMAADNIPLSILLIDNGSADGSGEWINEYAIDNYSQGDHWVVGCVFEENTGFTNAVNEGLRFFSYQKDVRHIALVNPDIVLCEGWLSNQLPIFTEHDNCGIIGCRQVRGAEIVHAGGMIRRDPIPLYENIMREVAPGIVAERMENICYSRFIHRMGHVSDDSWNVTETVPWVTFACALLKKDMVEEIGPLDSRFFNYCSDAEYCCRAWRYGWEVWYTASATVYHHVGSSEKSGGQSVIDRKIADFRLFAQEEDGYGAANRARRNLI